MTKYDKKQKIAVFDSGVGGISVLNHLIKVLPNEDYIYMADAKNAPYGRKSKEQVVSLAQAAFDKLMSYNVKAIVVACNTSWTQFINKTNELKYQNVNFFGIKPEIENAVLDKSTKNILLMATKVTCESPFVQNAIKKYSNEKNIYVEACQEIVPFVENDTTTSKEFEILLTDLIGKYQNVDSVILGCTHFPFVKNQIENVLCKNSNKKIVFFDNAINLSLEIKQALQKKDLLCDSKPNCIPNIQIIDTLSNSNERLNLYKKLIEIDNNSINFINK